MSKNLDVARCIPVIGEKVLIQRDIAQRDAIWLMQIVGREPDGTDAGDPDGRAMLLKRIESLDIAPAKAIFRVLRATLKNGNQSKARKGLYPIAIKDRSVGAVRTNRNGKVTIELLDAGDIPLDELMAHVSAVVAQTRRS